MTTEGLGLVDTLARGLATTCSVALLRGPADAGADSAEPVAFGLPQVLLTLGLIFLLVMLAVLVVWRIRRTRSK
jgi:hypothetical protein